MHAFIHAYTERKRERERERERDVCACVCKLTFNEQPLPVQREKERYPKSVINSKFPQKTYLPLMLLKGQTTQIPCIYSIIRNDVKFHLKYTAFYPRITSKECLTKHLLHKVISTRYDGAATYISYLKHNT